MRLKRTKLLWLVGAAVLAVFVGLLLLSSGSSLPIGAHATLNVSGSEVLSILEREGALCGGESLNLSKAVKDTSYRKVYGRLLLGGKLTSIATSNASLQELGVAFAHYSACGAVMVPGDAQELRMRRFGAFDSGNYRTRWSAARAISVLLTDAGWHLEQLTSGTVVFLSPDDYQLVLTAKSPALQSNVCEKFDNSNNAAEQKRCGAILSRVWRTGFLDYDVKGQLVEKHYRLVLRQLPGDGWPSWDVRIAQTFPFPEIATEFTPTLYRNNQIVWAPGQPQMGCAMDVAGRTDGNPIASMSGGEFKNGDVLQCKIELSQKINGRLWQRTLWTDKITLQGLKQ